MIGPKYGAIGNLTPINHDAAIFIGRRYQTTRRQSSNSRTHSTKLEDGPI